MPRFKSYFKALHLIDKNARKEAKKTRRINRIKCRSESTFGSFLFHFVTLQIEGKQNTPLLLTDVLPTAPEIIETDESMQEDTKKEESDEEKSKNTVHSNSLVALHYERECYICHVNFMELHHFYDKMCPKCAALNWEKRNQKCDLTGKVALVTGARVKVSFPVSENIFRLDMKQR